jgi:hypothetical protein
VVKSFTKICSFTEEEEGKEEEEEKEEQSWV